MAMTNNTNTSNEKMQSTRAAVRQPAVLALLWQALTPLHAGTGQVSSSVIDLPVAREGSTGYPMIPASSIKGVLRDGEGLRKGDNDSDTEPVKTARELFGYTDRRVTAEDKSTGKQKETFESGVGDLSFTDARLLALPVPSYAGTFALVTCPLVIRRLSRDRETLGLGALPQVGRPAKTPATDPTASMMPKGLTAPAPVQQPASPHPTAYVAPGTVLKHGAQVILQDLDFAATESAEVAALAEALCKQSPQLDSKEIASRLCIVPDDIFAFLCETALEVTAHIRLEPDRKTVQTGALWYEETLPAEALLTSFAFSRSGRGFTAVTEKPYLQLGGKGSVGRGLMRVHAGERAGEQA
jgi:CRISPR-associated protein Cmr4